MRDVERILVYHAAAIGDTVLATPVAVGLRRQFPRAHIGQISHSGTLGLIKLTEALDELIPCEQNYFRQYLRLRNFRPDLIVDLTGSSKSFLLTCQAAKRVLRYHKQPCGERPIVHAARNFLRTIEPLVPDFPQELFPTMRINGTLAAETRGKLRKELDNHKFVACVPGVGRLRSHRAWAKVRWIALIKEIISMDLAVLLIGGQDEKELCAVISRQTGALNLAGQLSLPQSAAVLSWCSLVVSCDTGPAHIAAAVGVPVVGLYGPTFIERSGPYGNEALGISNSKACSCTHLKLCSIKGVAGPGYCMDAIKIEDVCAAVSSAAVGDMLGAQKGPL